MDCPLTHSFISCLLALTSSGRELPTFCWEGTGQISLLISESSMSMSSPENPKLKAMLSQFNVVSVQETVEGRGLSWLSWTVLKAQDSRTPRHCTRLMQALSLRKVKANNQRGYGCTNDVVIRSPYKKLQWAIWWLSSTARTNFIMNSGVKTRNISIILMYSLSNFGPLATISQEHRQS